MIFQKLPKNSNICFKASVVLAATRGERIQGVLHNCAFFIANCHINFAAVSAVGIAMRSKSKIAGTEHVQLRPYSSEAPSVSAMSKLAGNWSVWVSKWSSPDQDSDIKAPHSYTESELRGTCHGHALDSHTDYREQINSCLDKGKISESSMTIWCI